MLGGLKQLGTDNVARPDKPIQGSVLFSQKSAEGNSYQSLTLAESDPHSPPMVVQLRRFVQIAAEDMEKEGVVKHCGVWISLALACGR
jgi:hypothetical protein